MLAFDDATIERLARRGVGPDDIAQVVFSPAGTGKHASVLANGGRTRWRIIVLGEGSGRTSLLRRATPREAESARLFRAAGCSGTSMDWTEDLFTAITLRDADERELTVFEKPVRRAGRLLLPYTANDEEEARFWQDVSTVDFRWRRLPEP